MLGLLCGAVLAAPLDVLRDCARTADPATRGLPALEIACPQLAAALADLGVQPLLHADDSARLPPGGLADLARLVERYPPAPAGSGVPGFAPDPAPVRGIIDGLTAAGPAPTTWWEAFKSWVRSLFDRGLGLPDSWFDRWWRRLSVALNALTVLLLVLMLGVLVLAGRLVWGELKAAGVLARKPAADPMRAAAAPAAMAATLALLDAAPRVQKPAILLRLLVRGLSLRGRLPPDRHLTHRELARRARLDDAGQQHRFAQVAEVAEGILYGPRPGALEGLDRVIEEGRELLRQLEQSSMSV